MVVVREPERVTRFFFVGFLRVKKKLVWLTDSVNQCLLYMSIIIAAFNAVALEITSLD